MVSVPTHPVGDNDICYYADVLDPDSKQLLELIRSLRWSQDVYNFSGRQVKAPRLTAWYGTKGYSYSGVTKAPMPFTATLLAIKTSVEEITGGEFNSVLANLYRNGKDSVSYHADDEKELGPTPTIASVSLGITRTFMLRSIYGDAGKEFAVPLEHGSLLVMKGHCQHNYKHGVPKQYEIIAPRVNLTFRTIL